MTASLGVAAALALGPAPAAAHPHLFVDTEVELVLDASGLKGVRLTWRYDEFFSLLLTEDLGLDQDFDGVLSREEVEILANYVLDWPDGYEGDLVVSQNGRPLRLGARREASVTYDDGQLIETHFRPVTARMDAPVTVKVYDPAYYTAYTIIGPIAVTGREDCSADLSRADLIAATERVDELLYAMPQDEAEMFFPMVGEDFADTVIVACSRPS